MIGRCALRGVLPAKGRGRSVVSLWELLVYRPTSQIIHPFAKSPSNSSTYAFANPPLTPIDTHFTCLSKDL